MPRVPRYDEPQVSLRPAPTVRQESSDYLGPVRQLGQAADAVGQAGDVVFRNAIQQRERTTATELFSREAAGADKARMFETEALAAEGVNAWGLQEKGKQFWEQVERELSDGLTSPQAQRLWKQSAQRMRESSLDRLSMHEARQRRASLKDSTNASIVGLTNAAAGDPTPENIAAQRDQIVKRRQILADLNGETAEERAVNDGEVVSNLHAQVLDGMIERNPTEAGRYLKANKKEIDQRKLPALERSVRAGTLKTVAQEAADAVELGGMNEIEALAHARKKYEGDEEAAVVAEIKTRFGEKSALREADQKTAADEAFGIIGRGGRLSDVPARTLARMDGKVLMELRREASGEKAVTDWGRYAELREMARGDPAAFKKLDLRKEFGHLAPTQREALLDLQSKDGAGMKRVRSLDGQINAVLAPLDLEPAEKAVIEDQIRAEVDATGAEAKDWGKVIDRMLVNGEVKLPGDYFSSDKQYFEVPADQREQFKVNEVEIPDADRDMIVRWFKEKRSRVPSESEIQKKYKQAVGLD